MASRKTKPGKRESSFQRAMRLGGEPLIEHLALNADGLLLSATHRRRVAIAKRLIWLQPWLNAARIYQGADVDHDLMTRAAGIGAAIVKALVSRGETVREDTPFRIAIEAPDGESLVEHLARNADRLGLSDVHKRRLAEAFRLWGDDNDRRSADARRRDRGGANAIAAEVQAILGSALGETVELEVQRDGKAGVQRMTGGRTRICNRDGLMLLYDSGVLTGMSEEDRDRKPERSIDAWTMASVRMAGGLAYREHLEHLAADLRSNLGGTGLGCSGAMNTADHAARARATASRIVSQIDQKVQLTVRSPKAIQALRLVAGEGRTVRSIAPGGKNVELTTRALIRALDVAAHILKVPGHAILTEVHE